MTYDHSDALHVMRALAARPHPLAEVRTDRLAAVPAERGLYAWWRRSAVDLPGVPAAEPRSSDDAPLVEGLLYVGISPDKASSGARLRSRLRQHLQGRIGSSTVRRTLAALLRDELGLRPGWAGKHPTMSPDEEARLSAWQDEHLLVGWVAHPEPWLIEGAVIDRFGPPMNLDGNRRHPFHPVLKERRARFRAEARKAAAPAPAADLPHLFLTQGDLTHLACDAFLVPSGTAGDRRWHVETRAWIAALNGRRSGTVDADGFVVGAAGREAGRTWEVHPRAVEGGVVLPAMWIGHTGDDVDDPEWYSEGVAAFVRDATARLTGSLREEAALREQHRRAPEAGASPAQLAPEPPARPAGSDRPLLGIPLVGTGAGGAAGRKDDTLRAILGAVRAAQRQSAAAAEAPDVVLVLHGRADFAAAQQARRELWGDDAFAALADAQRSAAARLAKEARAGQLVPFVGAGAGIGAGLPSWSGLLQVLAERADLPEEDRPALAKLDARDQADVLARLLPDGGLKAAVVALTGGEDRRVSLTHQLLASMPVREVVTTNYDECLETAFRDADRPLRRIGDARPERGVEGWLLKMHGGVHDPDSIVLSRADYLRFEGEGVALAGVVQAMLLTRHLAFVGYSLSDDNFHRLVHQAAQVGAATGHVAAERATNAGRPGAVPYAAGRPGRTMRATALTPEPAGFLEQVWGDRVDVVSTASPGHIDARRLAILLDAVAADTAPPTEHLLDPSYERLFEKNDRVIGERLADLWAAVDGASAGEGVGVATDRGGASLVADAVREALARIGPRPGN